jgi:MFS family permease
MPPASATLRLLAFTVPAGLTLCAIQPLIAAMAGGVHAAWALSMSVPALLVALAMILTDRLSDRDGAPPWYSAWALWPGAFLLAGAASMCIFGALVEMPAVRGLEWVLLAAGAVTWAPALILVRLRTHRS